MVQLDIRARQVGVENRPSTRDHRSFAIIDYLPNRSTWQVDESVHRCDNISIKPVHVPQYMIGSKLPLATLHRVWRAYRSQNSILAPPTPLQSFAGTHVPPLDRTRFQGSYQHFCTTKKLAISETASEVCRTASGNEKETINRRRGGCR
jgi:hypothetical protein